MGNQAAITLKNLTKSYGSSRGIIDISFDVNPGEVFGFLGPNGAGKTTAIRTLMGLIHATSGSAQVLGVDALKSDPLLRQNIGYLPGALNLFQRQTPLEMLTFLSNIRGVDCEKKIFEYASRLKLDLHRKIDELSKGNRQKVGVIQAFMHSPKVLILDEPTSGLDPLAQQEFELMLDEVKKQGTAVILSSHVLSEVEHLADRVAIINDGRLLVVDSIANLKQKATRKIELFFDKPINPSDYTSIENVISAKSYENSLTCTLKGHETDLLRQAVKDSVITVQTHETSLEEIFLDLVQKAGQR
ncbi:CcmA ABC-type multidrug transport system, ATPase component [Candidatus Nanopelagicaceae bacterium]